MSPCLSNLWQKGNRWDYIQWLQSKQRGAMNTCAFLKPCQLVWLDWKLPYEINKKETFDSSFWVFFFPLLLLFRHVSSLEEKSCLESKTVDGLRDILTYQWYQMTNPVLDFIRIPHSRVTKESQWSASILFREVLLRVSHATYVSHCYWIKLKILAKINAQIKSSKTLKSFSCEANLKHFKQVI